MSGTAGSVAPLGRFAAQIACRAGLGRDLLQIAESRNDLAAEMGDPQTRKRSNISIHQRVIQPAQTAFIPWLSRDGLPNMSGETGTFVWQFQTEPEQQSIRGWLAR